MDRETAEQLMWLYQQLSEPLNLATEIIGKLPDQEEQKRLRRPLGKLMADVWTELMAPIVRQFPELDPDRQEGPDRPLTSEEESRVSHLTAAELRDIDAAVLSNTTPQWRKVAMIIGLAMSQLSKRQTRVSGVPDVFYAMRIRKLVEQKFLEGAGNLTYMRYGEVRLPVESENLGTEGGV